MWTAISSYIWGESDEQIVPGCSVVDIQGDDDWILVELRQSKLAGKILLFWLEILPKTSTLFLNVKESKIFKVTSLKLTLNENYCKCLFENLFPNWGAFISPTKCSNRLAYTTVASYLVFCAKCFLIYGYFYCSSADKEKEVSKLKVQVQMEESWYVTPPPCFEASGSGLSPEVLESSPMEDLLIEHPSMSVYGPGVRQSSPSVSSSSRSSSTPRSEEVTKVEKRQPRRTVQFQAQLDLIEKRQQTVPPSEGGIRPNKKGLKKQNMVHFQNNTKSKRNKKRNRMLGKHVGMHGKRGC